MIPGRAYLCEFILFSKSATRNSVREGPIPRSRYAPNHRTPGGEICGPREKDHHPPRPFVHNGPWLFILEDPVRFSIPLAGRLLDQQRGGLQLRVNLDARGLVGTLEIWRV